MKKNNKVNPLTHFNNLKAAAVKKADKDMSTYKKSLKKAQDGIQAGPMTQEQAAQAAFASPANDPMAGGRGPRVTSRNQAINNAMRDANTNRNSNALYNSMYDGMKKNMLNEYKKNQLNAISSDYNIDPSTGKMIDMGRQRKGGSVKKMQNGGKVNAPKKPTISDGRVNADGSKPKTVAPGPRPRPLNPDNRPPATKSSPSRVVSNTSSKKAASVSGKKIIKEQDGSLSINKKNTSAINKAHAAGKTVYIPRNKYGGSITKKK